MSSIDDGFTNECDKDEDLYWKCSDEWDACFGKCPKVNTDFDVDIEGAFVEEA